LFNAAVEGISVRLGAHLCFGNYAGKTAGQAQLSAGAERDAGAAR